MNNRPNSMARIPTMIFNAENSVSIDAIPKNSKLTPIMMDTNPELKIGKIIKIKPKIMDSIPDDLLASMFFPPNFCYAHFAASIFKKIQKAICFLHFNYFLHYLIFFIIRGCYLI